MLEQDILHAILNKYPERAVALKKLFHEDENFRDICEDYFLCLNSLRKIIVTNAMKNNILVEYINALRDLEMEMLEYLNTKSTI